MSKNKIPEILTDNEIKLLLSQFNNRYPTSKRNMLMIQFASETGCRISEIINLKWNDIIPEENKIHLKHTKGQKHRIIFIKNSMIDGLRELRKCFPEADYVFTTLQGLPVKDSYLRKMIHQKALKAGIGKRVHFHQLRHTKLTELYNKTHDLRLVQEIAGHSDISTTQIYTHISPEQIKHAMIN